VEDGTCDDDGDGDLLLLLMFVVVVVGLEGLDGDLLLLGLGNFVLSVFNFMEKHEDFLV